MAKVQVSETISAPLPTVFDLFADFHHTAQHVDGITSVEVLTDGPIGVGTRFRETRMMFGREASEEMTVTEFEKNVHYRVEAQSHGAHYLSDFDFAGHDGQTVVTMTFEMRPVSLFARLFSFLSGPMLKATSKACHQDMQDLKRVAESQ